MVWKIRDGSILSCKGDNYIIFLPKRLRDQQGRGSRKTIEVVNIWREMVYSGHGRTFCIFTSACDRIHKTCTRASQLKLQHGWEGAHDVPPLTEKLLAADGCHQGKSQFSSGTWSPTKSQLCFWGQSLFVSAILLSVQATLWAPGNCPILPPISAGL